MRIERRARSEHPPRALWQRLRDLRAWVKLLQYPGDDGTVRRVKLLADAQEPGAGERIQVLFEDKRWAIYTIMAWDAGKRLELRADAEGHGDAPGTPLRTPRHERLILIPQGSGSEAEWSIRLDIGLVGRLVAPALYDRTGWADALDARVAALVA